MRKYIFSGIFIIALFIFSAFNLIHSYPILQENRKQKDIKSIEKEIDENILMRYGFIEGYGLIQKIFGKNEINNFEAVKDKKGSLYAETFQTGPYYQYQELVNRVVSMQEAVKASGCEVIALITPVKDLPKEEKMANSFPTNYFNETADLYRRGLKDNDIKVLDFRTSDKCSAISEEDKFYRTDHHWKIETAFAAFCDLAKEMNWDEEGFYTNPENYNWITYQQSFLGSYGRKVGLIYGGLDDFTAIYPKFPTQFSYYYEVGEKSETLQGRFEEALFYSNYLESDNVYTNDSYMCYLESVRGFDQITNVLKPEGERILFIRDSYTAPLAAFTSQVCGQVDMIYTLGYDKSIEDYIEANKENYDYIFVSIYPENMTLEAYPFYEE